MNSMKEMEKIDEVIGVGVENKVSDTVGVGSIRTSQEATMIAETELGKEIKAVRELMAKNRLAS